MFFLPKVIISKYLSFCVFSPSETCDPIEQNALQKASWKKNAYKSTDIVIEDFNLNRLTFARCESTSWISRTSQMAHVEERSFYFFQRFHIFHLHIYPVKICGWWDYVHAAAYRRQNVNIARNSINKFCNNPPIKNTILSKNSNIKMSFILRREKFCKKSQ